MSEQPSFPVHLPKTEFPMKANLAQSEPARIAKWKELQVYQKMVAGPKPGACRFTMPDGPPYANGSIHVGHVLNKVLKDIVIKYKNMTGFQAAFIPGWDCHGLPIELNVTKKLGSKRQEMTDADLRDLCRKEALTWVEKQAGQFQRLGVLADWAHPYLTMQPTYEADEIRVLAKIHANGYFYRGEKPVYWCPALRTALAAAEVEYREHKSLSIFVKFPFKNSFADVTLPNKPLSFLIWTTTPWTLPANVGLSLNSQFTYGFFESENDILILATGLKESVEKETGLNLRLIAEKSGQDFERMQAQHPFIQRSSLIVLGDHVTLEAGSGVVHTAPGHGLEDYVVGLKYGLPVLSPVDEAGRYTAEVPEFVGQSIWEANAKIVELLRGKNQLVAVHDLVHQYPHNPRSKTPLIFRATPQWFIRMDGEGQSLRKLCLESVKNDIQFVPEWGRQRLEGMLSFSPDWCLSRQRIWGVPIPVFYCDNCKTPLVNSEVMSKVADKMEGSGLGLEAYFSTPESVFTSGHACEKCQGQSFSRGRDILDVWFDSGVGHTAVQERRAELDLPADIYLEGSDQHRGWFQTSLVSSMAANKKAPFKALVTHGFVNDAQGYKMSKSLGNTVDPEEIIKESGAEILRLWVSHEDYGQDLSISKESITRITDSYRRFRNTIRFLLGNLADFDIETDRVPVEKMTLLDQFALHRLNVLITQTTEAYEAFEFYKVYHLLNSYFALDLSATYLDILKDRLYTGKVNGPKRRGSQTVLFEIASTLSRLMAPILSFLSEETFQYLPGQKLESVFLADFPKSQPKWHNETLAKEFEQLLQVRSEAAPLLEDLRRQKIIGASLDARLKIEAPAELMRILQKYERDLKEFFIVSQVQLVSTVVSDLKISCDKALGEKCSRCWHYDEQTNFQPDQFPGLCPKCVEALT